MPKPKPYVDERTLALLQAVAKAAGELCIAWMVTGAAGRVMLLEGCMACDTDAPHRMLTWA